jgi:drug/metabolite transporter (DMT)-like permease
MSSRFLLGALCAVVTITIWAGWLVVMRVGMASHLALLDLIALRFAVAGIVMVPVVMRRGWALDQLGWTGLAAIVIGGGAAYTLIVGAGLAFAPVAYASAFTQGVLPLTTAVMAVIVLKEKLTAWRKIGIVLIIAGAVMIAGLGPGDFGGRESIGHAIFLSATLLWAAYTVALRKARLDGLHATAIAGVASLIERKTLVVGPSCRRVWSKLLGLSGPAISAQKGPLSPHSVMSRSAGLPASRPLNLRQRTSIRTALMLARCPKT